MQDVSFYGRDEGVKARAVPDRRPLVQGEAEGRDGTLVVNASIPTSGYTSWRTAGSELRPVAPDDSPPAPCDPTGVLSLLARLGVEASTYEHEPVLTVAEARLATAHIPGCHCKNLFLEERGGSTWLVVLREDKPLDLTSLSRTLGTRRLSFASPEKLWTRLGIATGSVSPLAVVNDPEGKVRVVLDRELLSHPALKFHPLANTKTTVVSPDGLLRFLEARRHLPRLLDL